LLHSKKEGGAEFGFLLSSRLSPNVMAAIVKLISGDKEYTDLSKPIKDDNYADGVRHLIYERFKRIPRKTIDQMWNLEQTLVVKINDKSSYQILPGNLDEKTFAEVRAYLQKN
jgi:hypothetical protein